MFDKLKVYCKNIVPLEEKELQLIDSHFEVLNIKKKDFLLREGKICNFLGFVEHGTIRHFHIKNGLEKTCDISSEYSWVTDFQSFNQNKAGIMNLQALEDSTFFIVKKNNLRKLYSESKKYEPFGRIMAEKVAQRATEIAMSLSSDKPEERFQKLIESQTDLFQKVPQKYLANFIGVSPESFSRIRKRIAEKSKS